MISESELLEGLSEHYKEVIQKFFDYSKHQTSLGLKEISSQTKQATGVWIKTQNSFSQGEVSKITDNVKVECESIFKKEIRTQNFALCELLRQVFQELEKRAITINLDLSSIENIDIINKLDFLEKKKRTLNPLRPSLKPIGSKATEFETMEKLKKKNKELRKKLTQIQLKYAEMMKEKNELNKKNEELNTSIGELKTGMEGQVINSEEKDRIRKELETSFSSESEKNSFLLKELKDENEKMKNENTKLKTEMRKVKKEVTAKVSETTQFKNLKAILAKKNALIKELRDKNTTHAPFYNNLGANKFCVGVIGG